MLVPNTGWTEEDQQIWRDRKMKPHTIQFRYQQHVKESELMVRLTSLTGIPPKLKMIAQLIIK